MKVIKIVVVAVVALLVLLYMVGYYKSIRSYNENIADIVEIKRKDGVKTDFEIISHRISFDEHLVPYWKITFKDRSAHRGYGSCTWYYNSDKDGISSIMY